ncbi:MAG: hypothetical protein QM736_29730 [Vicinamibacterales bacterium]
MNTRVKSCVSFTSSVGRQTRMRFEGERDDVRGLMRIGPGRNRDAADERILVPEARGDRTVHRDQLRARLHGGRHRGGRVVAEGERGVGADEKIHATVRQHHLLAETVGMEKSAGEQRLARQHRAEADPISREIADRVNGESLPCEQLDRHELQGGDAAELRCGNGLVRLLRESEIREVRDVGEGEPEVGAARSNGFDGLDRSDRLHQFDLHTGQRPFVDAFEFIREGGVAHETHDDCRLRRSGHGPARVAVREEREQGNANDDASHLVNRCGHGRHRGRALCHRTATTHRE